MTTCLKNDIGDIACLLKCFERGEQETLKTQTLYIDHILDKCRCRVRHVHHKVHLDGVLSLLERYLVGCSEVFIKHVLSSISECCFNTDFDKLLGEIRKHHDMSTVSPGEAVGAISVQSFSERLTQATLNSFHLSGTKDSPVTGMKNVLDMLNASKSPKVTTIYPLDDYIDTRQVYLKDIIVGTGAMFYPVMSKTKRLANCPYCKFFVLNEGYSDLFHRIPLLLNQLYVNIDVIFVDTNVIVISGKSEVSISSINKITNILLKGIGWYGPGVRHGPVLTLAEGDGAKLNNIDLGYFVDRMPEILNGNFLTKIRTNNIHFIYNNFGIEAVRTYLLETIPAVLGKEGIDISFSHVELIVDVMTYQGVISPFTRSGMFVEDGLLLRASFETATTTLSEAACKNLSDDIVCPTSSIIMGQAPSLGTMYGLDIIEHETPKDDYVDFEVEYANRQHVLQPEVVDEVHFFGYESDHDGDPEGDPEGDLEVEPAFSKRQRLNKTPELEMSMTLDF